MTTITYEPDAGLIAIRAGYAQKDACKAITGAKARYNDATGRFDAWVYPATATTAADIREAVQAGRFGPATIDPAVEQLAGDAQVAVDTDEVDFRSLTAPYDHQKRGYGLIDGRQSTMLAWEMGAGKTKPVVDWVANARPLRTLILCPKAVVAVWPAEFAKHAALPVKVVALEAKSVKARAELAGRICRMTEGPLVLVLNYEAAWREPFRSWALAHPWDAIVCDESHRIKSPGGKASRFVGELGKRARRRYRRADHMPKLLALTGTPMPHSPMDLYAQFRFLDPGIFGTSAARFKAQWAIMGGYQKHEIVAWRDVPEMHRRMAMIADRVRKADVLDLPEMVHEKIPIDLGAKSREAYHACVHDMALAVRAGIIVPANALVRLLRLQQITGGYLPVDDGQDMELGDEKQAAIVDLLTDLDPTEPLAVFCKFHHDLDAIHAAAAKAGRQSVELSGRRNDIGARWQDGPDTVAAVQIRAGGLGIDLTRARYGCFYSVGFSLGDYEQALARLHRQGQYRSVTYIHLVAANTVDEKVYSSLQAKADVVDAVLQEMRAMPLAPQKNNRFSQTAVGCDNGAR